MAPTLADKQPVAAGHQSVAGRLGLAVAMLLGMVLVMSPWWIRNAWVTGRFVPTTLQVGASLYDGLNLQATGASDMRFVPPFAESLRSEPPPTGSASEDSFEWRLDDRLRRAAVEWAKANPAEVLWLAVVKLARMWNVWPNEPSLALPAVRLIVFFTYVPIAILGIMGLRRTLGRGWAYTVCLGPALYLSLLHMVFVSSIRYRLPALLPWMVLAAWAARSWFPEASSAATRACGDREEGAS